MGNIDVNAACRPSFLRASGAVSACRNARYDESCVSSRNGTLSTLARLAKLLRMRFFSVNEYGCAVVTSVAIQISDSRKDWSGALHSLAWWLASTNRWRTTARSHSSCVGAVRPCLVLCSRFRRQRREDCFQSARLRLREDGAVTGAVASYSTRCQGPRFSCLVRLKGIAHGLHTQRSRSVQPKGNAHGLHTPGARRALPLGRTGSLPIPYVRRRAAETSRCRATGGAGRRAPGVRSPTACAACGPATPWRRSDALPPDILQR